MFIRSYYDLDGDGFEYEINVSDGKHNLRCFADSKPNIGNGKVNLYATLILSIVQLIE